MNQPDLITPDMFGDAPKRQLETPPTPKSAALTLAAARRRHARRSDPEPSHAAAAALTDKQLSTLEGQIIAGLTRCGERGATSLELSELIQRTRVSVSPMLKPMEEAGLVWRAPKEERRAWKSPVKSTVWKLPRFKRTP